MNTRKDMVVEFLPEPRYKPTEGKLSMDKENDEQPALFPGVFHSETPKEPDQQETTPLRELENEGQQRLF